MLSTKAPSDLHKKHSWVPPNFLKALIPTLQFWRQARHNIYISKSPRPTHQTITIFCSSNPETRLLSGFSNCPKSATAFLKAVSCYCQALREQPQDQEAKEPHSPYKNYNNPSKTICNLFSQSFQDAVLNSLSLQQASNIPKNMHPTGSISNLQGKGDSRRRAWFSWGWSSLWEAVDSVTTHTFHFSPCSTQIWFNGHWYSPANYISQAKLEKQLLLFHALRSSKEKLCKSNAAVKSCKWKRICMSFIA